jgi:uncharacterized protein (DUF1501 family)
VSDESEPEPALNLHPECPDVDRLGPNRAEATLRAMAARVDVDRQARTDAWSRGFTRRRFLAGAGMAGVASLGTQLVTTRASFAAEGGGGTLVVVFLRGGMDGLSVVVPADDPHMLQARPDIAVRAGSLLPLDRGFGLHPALAPLHELWNRGQFTAVPAVSTPEVSRSHFQAQDLLERGGSTTGANEGWLDRVLDRMGPGTTFRSLSRGSTIPRALAGDQPTLSLRTVESFKVAGWEGVHDQTIQALSALYTGLDHPIASAVTNTLTALETAEVLNATSYEPGATYPEGDFGTSLTEIARLVKSDVGLRVAAIDVGGWDMHTRIGTLDGGEMQNVLTPFGEALGAFATDLGDRFDDVTVVAMTEFGRRVAQNANNGTDHGHGAAVLLLGGHLAGGTVHGNWQGLAPEVLDQGDVPGSNDYRNVLGDVVSGRLGLTSADLAAVFPGHQFQPVGVMS